MRIIRTLTPILVSVGFLGWAVSTVSLEKLRQAAGDLNWLSVTGLTVGYLFAVYLLDAVCLWRLFDRPQQPLTYCAALRARGYSYLFGIFHYGLGQAMLVWLLAKAQGGRVTDAALRCIALAFVDLAVLFSLGLAGASLNLAAGPHTRSAFLICSVGLGTLVGMSAVTRLATGPLGKRLRKTRVGAWFSSWEWDSRLLGELLTLRLGFNLLLIIYASVGFYLCGIPIDVTVVVSSLPLVALVTALPISISGLGTREAALVALIPTGRPEMLIAFSLLWGVAANVFRGLLGLGWLWYDRISPLAATGGAAPGQVCVGPADLDDARIHA